VLGGDPVPGTGRQIQKAAGRIAKNSLHGGILHRIRFNVRDMEKEDLALGIDELHFVTHVELTQTPKHGRVSARAIQVSGNHGTAPIALARTARIQTDITPGTLPGCVHSAIGLHTHRLDGGIDTNGRNEQPCRRCRSRVRHERSARQPA